MPIPKLKDLFAGGASKLVETVSNVVDEFTLSKEEKSKLEQELLKATNEHTEKMAAIAQAELESRLKDAADARNREIQIATADKAPLINKIVNPVIAFAVLILTFALFYMIMFKSLGAEKDIVIYILGVLSAVVTQIISYYFGSSSGSKASGDTLRKLIEK